MFMARASGILREGEEGNPQTAEKFTSNSPVAGDGEFCSLHPRTKPKTEAKIIVLCTICFRRRKTIKKSNLKDIFYAISPRVVTASVEGARSIHLATEGPPSTLTRLVNIRSLVMFCVGALAFFS